MSNGSSGNWYDKYMEDEEVSPQSQSTQTQQYQTQQGGNWYDKYTEEAEEKEEEKEEGKETGEKDTLIERTFGKNALTDFLGDLYRSGASGVAAGETTGESFDMFQEAGDKELTDEAIQKYIGAVEYAKNQDVTDEMKDFQRIYEEEGESLVGFFKGVASNPSILPQMLVSSFGTLGGSFFDSEEVAGFTALGAAAGSQIPIIGTAIGGFTGLTTAMETGLTYSELLQDKLNEDGLEFNTENIRKILENDEVRQSIMNRSLGRGLAIGAVEALTAGFASKATRGVSAALRSSSKRSSTAAAIGANVAVESTGGGLGEVLGRVAAGQEMDVAEIGFEAITGTTTTPVTLARGLRKGGQYIQKSKTGDQPMTRKQVVDFLETANDEEIASANIEIKNDPEIAEMARQKQDVILLKARIDDKITDEGDRKKLLNLEQQRQEAEGKTTTYFKNKLKRINKSIDEITNKYLDAEEEVVDKTKKVRTSTYKDGVDPKVALRSKYNIDSESIPKGNKVSKVFKVKESKKGNTAEVEFTSKEGKTKGEVTLNEITPPVDPKASRDIVDKAVKRDTIEKATATRRAAADAEFVKSFGAQERSFDNAEQVLKDVDELNKTLPKGQKIKISKEDRKAMDEVGGFYNAANNVVYINKEVASKMKNVGAHEVLHGILFKHVGDASKQKVLVDNFKNQISTKQKDDIEAYMSKRGYDVSIDEQGNNTQEYYEEYLSNFSDAVVDGVVKFDENVFTKIGDLIAPILRAAGFSQISFDTGKGVYNFMREYNKSIEKGRLSKPISSFLEKREKQGKTLNQKQLNTVQNAISNISKSADKQIPKAIKEKRSSVNFKKIAKNLDLKGITNEQLKELENNKGFTAKTGVLSKSIIDSDLDPLDAFNEITKDNDTYTELQKRVVKLLIDNGLLKNKFERYGGVLEEIRVINATEQNNKKKGNGRITIKKEGGAGYDSTRPDIQLVYKDSLGKETSLNIEVKKDQKADFSSRTISRVLDDNGNVKYEISNDDSNNGLLLSALQSLLEPKRDNNGEIIKGQEGIMDAFFNFVDKKTGKKSNRTLGAGVESIPLKVYEQWKNFENKNPDKKVGRTFSSKGEGKSKIDYSVDNIAKVYNDKGNYYIEIGGKGLYFLGMSDGSTNNMNIFNAPYLDNQGIINVRLRISFSRSQVDKNGMVKPRMRASFQIGVGKGNTLKPSKLSITNQETLNKSYDNLAESKSTDNLSESKKSTVNKSKETKTEQEGEDIEGAFNGILEDTTTEKGERVDAKTRYSDSMAKLMGKKSGRFAFIPPSAEDFMGLIYSFLGKGELGERQKRFFETYLNAPYKRGVAALESAKQRIHEGYRLARKNNPEARKKLSKKVPGQPFTYDQAVRMYIWKNQGTDLSGIGLNEKEIADLVKIVELDQSISKFANDVSSMQGIDGQYPPPGEFWLTENIASDLNNAIDKIGRKKFLKEFVDNRKQIFSKDNLNKIEAIYGSNFRDALEDIMTRMETGSNRPSGSNKQVNRWLNWINGSVGAIMFLNMKSASLQLISFVNYLNWNDNNPLNAAATFANPKQFAADFAMIFKSDKLKQRRLGTKISVSESELSSVAEGSGNAYKNVFNYLIKLGFKPTQIADSLAISFGGASMYRNRVNSNLKQGMSLKEAEKAAFEDFSAITEETQQSSDPSLISQQQSGPLGRIILAFANTPAQYARLTKKAISDLANNRGDWKTNISKIAYYAAIQNIIFSSMQTALFAMMFDDDSDEDEINEKEVMALNSMVDSLLRGSGVGGAALATVKNAIMEYHKQEKKKFLADHTHTLIQLTSVSPPISSKLRNIYSAILTTKYNKDVIEDRGFAIDQPLYRVGAKVIEAGTNVPLDRVMNKISNFSQIKEDEFKTWQRIMLALGWSTWSLGLKNQEHELIKINAQDARDKKRYKKAAETRKKNRESKSLKERRKKSRDRLRRD